MVDVAVSALYRVFKKKLFRVIMMRQNKKVDFRKLKLIPLKILLLG